MNIPGYDDWRLQGPDERADPVMEECPMCRGEGILAFGLLDCPDCEGTGEVEAAPDDPDDYGDYLYEQMRDRRM